MAARNTTMAMMATTLQDTTAMVAVRRRWASRRASSSRRFFARARTSWLLPELGAEGSGTRPAPWRTVRLGLPTLITPPLDWATRWAVVLGLETMGAIFLVDSSMTVWYWKVRAGFFRNSSRSFSSSVALAYRSRGSRAMAFIIICSIPLGMLGFRVVGAGAPPLMCWMATATGDSPS